MISKVLSGSGSDTLWGNDSETEIGGLRSIGCGGWQGDSKWCRVFQVSGFLLIKITFL